VSLSDCSVPCYKTTMSSGPWTSDLTDLTNDELRKPLGCQERLVQGLPSMMADFADRARNVSPVINTILIAGDAPALGVMMAEENMLNKELSNS
jgi:hypothetical protein